MNLSDQREKDESFEDYKVRRKTNKVMLKMYQKMGKDQCWEMYPNGFKSALDAAAADWEKSQQPTIKDKEDATTV
jgi:hypothetical protein